MVDLHARVAAARALAAFREGRITNDDFVATWPHSEDPAIAAIGSMMWNYYDDHRVHPIVGDDEPSPAGQALLERCILFLSGAHEYQWPERDFRGVARYPTVLNAISLGVLNRRIAERDRAFWERMNAAGDFSAWPFLRNADCVTANASIAERSN